MPVVDVTRVQVEARACVECARLQMPLGAGMCMPHNSGTTALCFRHDMGHLNRNMRSCVQHGATMWMWPVLFYLLYLFPPLLC